MNLYAVLEPMLIGLAMLGALFFMFGRIAPQLRRRLLAPLTSRLSRGSDWQRKLAQGMEPGAGCGSGCSTCGSCGSSKTVAPVHQPVNVVRHH
ncbi:DUF6587 family protein [Niveibacterium sp. SC-1]|uniref:DUF6587 family protein n=1 Tax=Niveibacterium sp. SC-1 TaxID=3135646 RepID=UPI0031201616